MPRSDGSFFGRRKGKTLKPRQREALERVLPGLEIDVSVPSPESLPSLFPVPVHEVCLEIGFGGGEHLLHEARSRPDVGFIGVEPFRNGLAKAALAIGDEGLRNIRLFGRDAVVLLDWLPPSSLVRVDLLFPDPWPKLRHWKRRFVNSANLDRIARCLKPGGLFRFASDSESYVRWTLNEVERHGQLVWTAARPEDCRRPWPGWPGTRYEAKAVAAGSRPAYLVFRREE
jgi:tRNA (guanine-N7-)-methyltransferase